MCCMRARAIENGCFVFAAAQGGTHENGRETFGHSLVVDPWGRIVAEGGTEPGVIMAEIDPAAVAAARGAHSLAAAWPPLRDHRADGGADASACGQGRVMIRYALVCDQRHEFESWFNNSAAYDKQAKRGLVDLPGLRLDESRQGDHGAGDLRRAQAQAGAEPPRRRPTSRPRRSQATRRSRCCRRRKREFRAKLKELRDHLTKNADNVGKKFPEEARKMHYGEIEHRSIYGEASPDDAKEMLDEGIEFHPLPILPDEKN